MPERQLPAHYRPLIEDLERHGIEYTPVFEHEHFKDHLIIDTTEKNRGKIIEMLNARVDAKIREDKQREKRGRTTPGFWKRVAYILGVPQEENKPKSETHTEISREMREPYMHKTSNAIAVLARTGGLDTGDLARSALEDWAKIHAKGEFADAVPLNPQKGGRKIAVQILPRNSSE